jgi:hypothetical protein
MKSSLVRKVDGRELLLKCVRVFPSGIFGCQVFPLDQRFSGKLGSFLDPTVVENLEGFNEGPSVF